MKIWFCLFVTLFLLCDKHQIHICLWKYIFAGRKLSPTPPSNRLSIEAPNEKDEGISDEEDPAELRLLLELNEQV